MTIKEALVKAHKQLESAGIDSGWLDAELLLAHVLNKPRPFLISHAEEQLTSVSIQQYDRFVARRCRGEPTAYMTGETEFCGLTFKVTKDVLIPRPATEELVETVIKEQETMINDQLSLIDVGTGSGCIAITLAKQIPHATIFAIDSSEKALAIAGENARRHGVANRITFLQGDLLEPVLTSQTEKLINRQTVLVANLPYVPTSLIASKPELQFEPTTALDGGPDGTLLYRRLFDQLSMISDQWLPALIALEIEEPAYQALRASPVWVSLQSKYTAERRDAALFFVTQKPRSRAARKLTDN